VGHRAAAAVAASTAAAATSLTTSLYGWAAFGASIATIMAVLGSIWKSAHKRRRKLNDAPKMPPATATREELTEWGIRMDQWVKDNAEDDD
jgi:glutamate/tyrosine decarboxylase-like PLP-dependent enzyme